MKDPLHQLLFKRLKNLTIYFTLVLMTCLTMSAQNASETKVEVAPEKKSLNMIFIGNSFTFYHSLPTIVQALLEEGMPERSVKTEIVGYGGRCLFEHWDLFHSYNRLKAPKLSKEEWNSEIGALKQLNGEQNPPPIYTDYYNEMYQNAFWKECYPWSKPDWQKEKSFFQKAAAKHEVWMKQADKTEKIDYLVLQSWQDETDSPESGYLKYAGKFVKIADEIGVKPVLYITAPSHQNEGPVTGAIKKDQILKTCKIAAEASKSLNAIVVPMPLAVMLVQESKEPIARSITLRFKKDFHPNTTMGYLTACTFYAALNQKSPEGLKLNTIGSATPSTFHGEAVTEATKSEQTTDQLDPDGQPKVRTLDDETRLFLQRIAWETVEKFNKREL